MEFFRIQKDIPFMRHALVFNVISFITFLLAVFFLAHRGLHLLRRRLGGQVAQALSQVPGELRQITQFRATSPTPRTARARSIT